MEGKFHGPKFTKMSPLRSDLQTEPEVHPIDWHEGFKGGTAGGHRMRSTVFGNLTI